MKAENIQAEKPCSKRSCVKCLLEKVDIRVSDGKGLRVKSKALKIFTTKNISVQLNEKVERQNIYGKTRAVKCPALKRTAFIG